jgi:hypothetical protein
MQVQRNRNCLQLQSGIEKDGRGYLDAFVNDDIA